MRTARTTGQLFILFWLFAGLPWMSPTFAQDGGSPAIQLALNKVEPGKDACRASFVVKNGLTAAIADLTLELVVFDKNGLVERFVNISTGALPAGKTRVRQFDFGALDCAAISKFLVNDVKVCEGKALTPQLCLSVLRVSGTKQIELML